MRNLPIPNDPWWPVEYFDKVVELKQSAPDLFEWTFAYLVIATAFLLGAGFFAIWLKAPRTFAYSILGFAILTFLMSLAFAVAFFVPIAPIDNVVPVAPPTTSNSPKTVAAPAGAETPKPAQDKMQSSPEQTNREATEPVAPDAGVADDAIDEGDDAPAEVHTDDDDSLPYDDEG